jgi:hypothetical protein
MYVKVCDFLRSQWVKMGSVGRMGRVGKRGEYLTARQCKALDSDNADYHTDSAQRSASTT